MITIITLVLGCPWVVVQSVKDHASWSSDYGALKTQEIAQSVGDHVLWSGGHWFESFFLPFSKSTIGVVMSPLCDLKWQKYSYLFLIL